MDDFGLKAHTPARKPRLRTGYEEQALSFCQETCNMDKTAVEQSINFGQINSAAVYYLEA